MVSRGILGRKSRRSGDWRSVDSDGSDGLGGSGVGACGERGREVRSEK